MMVRSDIGGPRGRRATINPVFNGLPSRAHGLAEKMVEGVEIEALGRDDATARGCRPRRDLLGCADAAVASPGPFYLERHQGPPMGTRRHHCRAPGWACCPALISASVSSPITMKPMPGNFVCRSSIDARASSIIRSV